MLTRYFLIPVLFLPTAAWAACTSQQVGTLTFSDCPADGHALNGPVASGVVLKPLSGQEEMPAAIRLVRPHETVDMSGQANSTAAKSSDISATDRSAGKNKAARKKANPKKNLPAN